MQYIQESIPDYRNSVIVALDDVKRATSYAERLRLPIAVLHGKFHKQSESDQVDGRNSPPIGGQHNPNIVSRTLNLGLNEMPVLIAKEKPALRVIGDIGGKIVIIISNMIGEYHWNVTGKSL